MLAQSLRETDAKAQKEKEGLFLKQSKALQHMGGYAMGDLERKIRLFHEVFPKLSRFEKMDWEENFLVEFTHDSTSIEGNTLTLIETKMILIDAIVSIETTLRELDEVRGHADAWQFVKDCVKGNIPLSENIIKDIHERVIPARGVGGIYRDVPVYIRGARHVPPHPHKVWDAMKNFAHRMEHDTFTDPIEKAAWIHATFVKIHPFQDGNGRTARLMMNYHLLANDFPPTSIKLKDRGEYFSALEEYAMQDALTSFSSLLHKNMEREMDAFLSMYAQHIDLHQLRRNSPALVPPANAYLQDSGLIDAAPAANATDDDLLRKKKMLLE